MPRPSAMDIAGPVQHCSFTVRIGEEDSTLDAIAGTQSIARAFAILRTLARFGAKGMPLREIARANGLNPATTHRMLQQLVQQGAIVQRKNSEYALGPLMSELSAPTYSRDVIVAACNPAMRDLSERTEESVFLIKQSGGDGLCLDRIEGKGIIRVITLEVGERRPLADSAAGIAILARQDDARIETLVTQVGLGNARYVSDMATMWASIGQTRKQGFAFVHRDELGISAVGMAVPIPNLNLAISLSSTAARLAEPRRSQIVSALTVAVEAARERLITLPYGEGA